MDPMMAKKILYSGLEKKMRSGSIAELQQKYGKSKSMPIPGVEGDVPSADADEAANGLAEAAQNVDDLAEHQEGGKLPDVALQEIGDISETLDPASPVDAGDGASRTELEALLQQLLSKTER